MSCPFCASDNPTQAQFCRACGAELPRPHSNAGLSIGAAPTDALPIGALLAGTYAVESVLGQGGFGITYRCHDQMLDRRVAIKEFFPAGCRREDAAVQPSRGLSDSHFSEARAQFLAEARLLARCHHAGIVGVHTAFEANSTAYMVMELLHGSHLAQLLDARGSHLDEAEAVSLIERAGEALQFVHDQGLLHRDIKPENIILCDDGRVMLIDFGTAREYAQGQAQGHTIVVTPGYAPLEQYAKQAKRGAFTDVYGLAATLYHLLTAQAPPAASDRAVGVQLRPVREHNPRISESVAGAVEAGLRMEIAKRPQSVREFLQLLRATQPAKTSASEVALSPQIAHENALAVAQRDALLALSAAPPGFFSGALSARRENLTLEEAEEARKIATYASPLFIPTGLDAHRQMSDATPSDSAPIKLAPSTPFPTASPTASPTVTPTANAPVPNNAVAPFSFSMSPDLDGGIQLKPASIVDDPTKLVYGWVGGIILFAGLLGAISSNSQKPQPPSYVSSAGSSPSSSSSGHRPSTSGSGSVGRSIAAGEAARREVESAPAILPVSTEILPVSTRNLPASVRVTAGQVKTPTQNAALSMAWSQGVAEFSPGGELVAYVSYMDSEAVVRVWSRSKRRVVSSLPQPKNLPPVAMRFSPDGRQLVVLYRDQGEQKRDDQVKVWDLATQKALGTLSVDSKTASLKAYEALTGGKVLFTRMEAGREQLFLWDARTGKQTVAPMKARSNAYLADFATDGKQLVTGDRMGQIRWWNVGTGAQEAEQSTALTYGDFQASPFYPSNVSGTLTQPLPVESVRLSRNGSYLAARNQMQIRVFDSNAQEIGNVPAGYSPEFAVSPDGRFVAGGAGYQHPGQNLLWQVKDGQKTRLQGAPGPLRAWSFSPDGKQITGLSFSPERASLVTWNVDARPTVAFSAPEVKPLSLPGDSRETRDSRASSRATSLAHRLTASATERRIEIGRFDGSLVNILYAETSPIKTMNFSPNGRLLSGRGPGGQTRIWDVQSGAQVVEFQASGSTRDEEARLMRHQGFDRVGLLFSPDHSLLARTSGAPDKNGVEIWSLGPVPRRIASLALSQSLTALTFSHDNRALIGGDSSGRLFCYDVAKQKLVAQTQNGPAPISQFMPTEHGVAVLSMGTRNQPVPLVTTYDVPSTGAPSTGQKQPAWEKKSQVSFNELRGSQRVMAFSPDGKFLVATSSFGSWADGFGGGAMGGLPSGGEVCVYQLPTGALLQKLPVEMAPDGKSPNPQIPPAVMPFMLFITAVEFSPDGSQLSCLSRNMQTQQQQLTTWKCPPREDSSEASE